MELIIFFNWLQISNKCFIHCPAEDKAETIIYWSKLQDEHKMDYTGGIIDKTMMYEAVRQMGWRIKCEVIFFREPLALPLVDN